MAETGLLLSLPTDSIAVRAALASVVAILLARLLLDGRLRAPRARVLVAMLPAAAIAVVVAAFAHDPALPSLWLAVEAIGGLTVPVRDTYLSFAPAAVPVVLGAWALVAVVRVAVRARRTHGCGAGLRQLAAVGQPAPEPVARTVATLAAALQTTEPRVTVVPHLSGGAAIVGVRRPLLLLDAGLLRALDPAELEGVLAHELAHVLRHDNLVAASLRFLRDVVFFVPGGAWSLRWLLREREHAADATAVALTGRPGALAGGLLKVIDAAADPSASACSPLLNEGTLVARVQQLCDDRPPPSRTRTVGEGAAVGAALVVALVAAVVLPDLAAGAARQRDALGVLLSEVGATDAVAASTRPAVFVAFDEAGAAASVTSAGPAPIGPSGAGALLPLDDPGVAAAQRVAACEQDAALCPTGRLDRTVSLTPRPVVRVADGSVDRWRLEPLVRSDNQQLGVFWFHRLPEAG